MNKRAYKTWAKDSDDAIRGGWHAQRNTILHELGHYIDFCNDPDFFRSVEHEWSLDNVDKKLVKKQLSEYSLTNRAEFEAELNSAILSGKVFSEDILSLSHMKQTKTSIAKQLLDYGSGKNVCLPSEEVSKSFKDAMKVVFNQKGGSFSIDIMADSKVQNLIEAHTDVLNRNIQRLEMSDTMRKRLTRSNYIFSGMKTFHELNEAFPSLLDSNGNRKTFEAFLNDVRKIDNTYNSNYLRAEYNFVQSSAEMAAKWEQFSEDGDRYNLQYRTANDGKVRPEHAALNGVTLPPSDPFWEEYYPPNGWNCRCTVVQVRKSKYPATPHDEAMALGEEALQRDIKGIFHFNPGKEDKTIPDYNPYTIRRCRDCDIAKGKLKLTFVPDNEVCAACRLLHECAGNREKTARAIERKHFQHEMEPLLSKTVTKSIGDKNIKIQFDKKGNGHLYSDVISRTRRMQLDDLKNMDEILERATYIDDAPPAPGHDNGFEHFYYFESEVNGNRVRINVGKRTRRKGNGQQVAEYFCYSVNNI